NFLAALIVSPLLLALLYPRVRRWGLLWTDILDQEDVAPGFALKTGAIVVLVASIGGLIVGVLAATGLAGQAAFGFAGQTQQVAVWLAVLPFVILLIVGSIMLSGREQFREV